MNASLLIGSVITLWLLSLSAAIAAFFLNLRPTRFSWLAPMALSFLALGTSYFGLRFLSFSASQSVNGQVQWSLNSKYFFLTTLALGALSLLQTLWTHRRPGPSHS